MRFHHWNFNRNTTLSITKQRRGRKCSIALRQIHSRHCVPNVIGISRVM